MLTSISFFYQAGEKAASEFYESFMEAVPSMELLARDRQPRGYGGVVNFDDDIEDETPIWWSGSDKTVL